MIINISRLGNPLPELYATAGRLNGQAVARLGLVGPPRAHDPDLPGRRPLAA